jgi:hypothetical protein
MIAHKQVLHLAVAFIALVALAGCRSRVVKVELVNTGTEPVSTIIVDYPSATFGKDNLAPGETFSYAIKPLETGPLKLQFTDAKGGTHTYTGPTLHKDDEGSLEIRFDQNGVLARPNLTVR